MDRRHVFAAAMLSVLLLGPRAEAGVYADDLAKCLVRSSSSDDHLIMIRWMFSAVTQHPALRSMSTVTPAQHGAYDHDMAKLTERLIFTDCRKEAVAGLKYEGEAAITAGFRVLGQVAARDMFGDSHVALELSALGKSFDKSKLSALYKEAGVPERQAPSPGN